jgi:hypothetical protein
VDNRYPSSRMPGDIEYVPSCAVVEYLTLRKLMKGSAFIGYMVVAQLSIQRNQLGPHHSRLGLSDKAWKGIRSLKLWDSFIFANKISPP